MRVDHTPTIFESFNARALKPSQVAKTFVPSRQFERLIRRCHSVVVGPRGSGKTTLLKMLQTPALEAWQHPLADKVRNRVDYTGVFVAADISWSEQLAALGAGHLAEEPRRLLGIAAFTTHTLRSLVKAFIARLPSAERAAVQFRRVELSPDAEATIVREIAREWHLKPSAATFLSLKHSLSARASRVAQIGSQARFLSESYVAEQDFVHLHFRKAASFAIEVFEDVSAEREGKWAFLFDELELAPEWIRRDLLEGLRSTDERFLFKLALSPSVPDLEPLQHSLAASPGHDYEQLPLWYAEKREAYGFCEQLWDAMLEERHIEPKSARQALGRSYFETPVEEWRDSAEGTAYRADSRIGRDFKSLAEKDPTFRSYLIEHGINLRKLSKVPAEERAAALRKVAPLVPLRDFYLRREEEGAAGSQRVRSRKSPSLYAGAESLFAISEGNPRWFIGIVDRLLEGRNIHRKRVPEAVQSREILAAAERFTAMLRTIAVSETSAGLSRGLLSLVEAVGEFLHKEAVLRPFSPEPTGSFTVDSHTPSDLLVAVEQALNAGAFVYIPDDEGQILLQSIRGKRFRLSYLLAPLYGFPLRLGPPASLGRILREVDEKRGRSGQLRLIGAEREELG